MSTGRDEAEMDRDNGKERRAASGHRVTFEGLVAVGGQGAGFEAESVDVSPDGMRLRTAYLPMPGDFLRCRFDAGTGEIVVRGEVVWCNEEARGGEFGLAFVDLDEATARALRALVSEDPAADEVADAAPAPEAAGTKGNRVRLHIEGLGSPMKARVRDADASSVDVGSALEFLKVGRTLELEDVDKGARREAWVDDVKVEIDPATQVPQLVVSLRFDAIGQARVVKREPAAKVQAEDEPAAVATRSSRPPARAAAPSQAPKASSKAVSTQETREAAPATRRAGSSIKPPKPTDDVAEAADAEEEDEIEAMRRGRLHDVGDKLKSGASAAMDKIAPAMSGLGDRARSLWGKAQEGIARRRENKEADKPRRVTAAAPSGSLKATGRRVVRTEEEDEAPESVPASRLPARKKTAAIGAVVGLVAVLGIWGITRAGGDEAAPMTANELRAAEAPGDKLPAIPGAAATGDVPLFGATPLSTTEQVVLPPAAISGQPQAGDAPEGEGDEAAEEDDAKPDAPTQRSFGQGEVKNAKILRIKMDGPLAGLKGEAIDGGFRIELPGRKSTTSASGLARKDKRIEALDVINKEEGAVVTVKFKGDEPPAYLAQVKGDRLEIAIGSDARKGSEPSEPAKKVASKTKSKKKDAKKKKSAD